MPGFALFSDRILQTESISAHRFNEFRMSIILGQPVTQPSDQRIDRFIGNSHLGGIRPNASDDLRAGNDAARLFK